MDSVKTMRIHRRNDQTVDWLQGVEWLLEVNNTRVFFKATRNAENTRS